MNTYFIGAKNVCFVFKPFLEIDMNNFIYHCDKLFGWVSHYHKKLGSNKIYVIFTTLIRGNEHFDKIENDNYYLEFPKEVFINNIPNTIKVRGYYGHNEQDIITQLPNVDNIQKIYQRILNIESFCNSIYTQQNNLNQLNSNQNIYTYNYQDEIEIVKNKIKMIENDHTNLQFVIRQQSTVNTLLLEKYVKIENDINHLNSIDTNNLKLISEYQNDLNLLRKNIDDTNNNFIKGIQIFETNMANTILEIQERQKWIEEINQNQHQYTIQKFKSLDDIISNILKNLKTNTINSNMENIEKYKNQENSIELFDSIKNFTKNLISLDNLDPIQIVNTDKKYENSNIQAENDNDYLNDNHYEDDMIIITKE